jgi:hypothetical protein
MELVRALWVKSPCGYDTNPALPTSLLSHTPLDRDNIIILLNNIKCVTIIKEL